MGSRNRGNVKLKGLAVSLSLLFGLAPVAIPQTSPEKRRPRIGLVLEGGGALGFAHIGVLKWLEEHRIPVDFVTGTSMGALVGGLYAAGKSPDEIASLVEEGIDWPAVLNGDLPYRSLSYRRKEDIEVFNNRIEVGLKGGITLPGGLNLGHQVGLVLARNTLAYSDLKNFDELPIPFRCVAVDLTDGKKRVFSDGTLSQALLATMSIPGIFAPAIIDGHLYSDGGVLDNLPVDVAKEMGANVIIAVYLDSGPEEAQHMSLLDVAGRNVGIVIKTNELRSMEMADVLVTAKVTGFTTMDFTKAGEIIPKGTTGAEAKKGMLERFSLPQGEWQQYLAARDSRKRDEIPVPRFVQVVGVDQKLDQAIGEYLASLANQPIDPDAIENKLDKVKGTGRFQNLNYSLVDKDGETGLLIRAIEKPYGPPFLNFAIDLDGSDPSDVRFTMRGRVTKMMNYDPRAEWRTDFAFGTYYGIATELYQPFSFKSWWFVAPHAAALRSPYDYYNQDELVAQYNLTSLSAGVDLGYALSRKAEVRVGEDIAYLKADRKVGIDEYPNHSGFTGVSTFRFVYLGQDDAIIPHQGLKSQTRGAYYTSGNDGKPYPMAETLNSYFVRLSPKGSLFFVADGGTAFGHKNLGITSFTLGGPLRFGAYGRNALIGDEYYLLQGGYLHRVASISPIIGEGVYAGAFYEIGKVHGPSYLTNQLPMDGSLLVVAKTILAPVFVGISIGDSARYKWWFGVGRVF